MSGRHDSCTDSGGYCNCQRADLLFGEQPKIQIPEAHEEKAQQDAIECESTLLSMIEETGFYNRLVEGAETSSAMSGVFYKVNWDQSLSTYPTISLA
ncbi:hypothetical protein [Mechercharimyces sp. CAU 1602]|uniref:hypothetical protein n=1 Tax=Mechercharimyces sp. CAU 1602 TaxID=2973933 RepID=UPI002162EE71|nr:hypothetical protein [Mechercharimyces sp. CAU 1602]MCS1350288.1 hypothetical protein [Mechercharimyces sp. CAU 1602]